MGEFRFELLLLELLLLASETEAAEVAEWIVPALACLVWCWNPVVAAKSCPWLELSGDGRWCDWNCCDRTLAGIPVVEVEVGDEWCDAADTVEGECFIKSI